MEIKINMIQICYSKIIDKSRQNSLKRECYVKKELHSKKNKKREGGDIMAKMRYSCKKQEKPLCRGLLMCGGCF